MNYHIIGSILALFALVGRCEAVETTARVENVPALAQAATWATPKSSDGVVQIDQWTNSIAASIASGESKTVSLNLKNPLVVPEWADGLTFLLGNDGNSSRMGLDIRFLVKDSADREFYFFGKSHLFTGRHRSEYFPNHYRGRPVRISTPALKQLKVRLNYEPVGHRAEPKPPYRIVSLQFDRLSTKPEPPVLLYFRDFAFTRLSAANSTLYYSINSQESFGELDPLPSVTLGAMGPNRGEDYSVSWEVRNSFDGQPFLTGGEHVSLNTKDPQYALALGKKIAFPIREKGTYWVRVKRKMGKTGSPVPDQINEWDWRLDIFRGEEAKKHNPIAADQSIPESLIRVAPERKSVIFGVDEPFALDVAYGLPQVKAKAFTCQIRLKATNGSEVLKQVDLPLAELPQKVKFDASEIPPGCYQIFAELLADGKVIDRTERLIGRAGDGKPVSAPAGSKRSPSGKELLANPKSLIYLDPITNEADPELRFGFMKNFLDQAPTICTTSDLQIDWRKIERLPGVYDWTEVDRFLAYAQEKKMTVLLWPQFCGYEPEWIPACFEQNRKGDRSVFGANMYSFHGGIINYWHAEPVRAALKRFVSALATRYANHPATHGFYLLTEHPGDHPSFDWYVGGSPETQADFRAIMRRQIPRLEDLNARWGTSYASWNEVGVPPENATPRHLLDWLATMHQSIRGLTMDLAKTVRKAAPDRLIMLYMGLSDDSELKEVKEMGGIMFADGGSHRPESFGANAMKFAMYGIPRRTEPSSVTLWADTSPYKLDASLYTMMLGGGGNANCKMFISASKKFEELRKEPYSLDRFERFIPIWNELHETEIMPRDAYILDDRNAALLQGGSTKVGSGDVWTAMCSMESGILAPAGQIQLVTQGKFLMLPPVDSYDKQVAEKLVSYVENGGTLVMYADAGRHSPDLPAEDWILLRRLGYEIPTGICQPGVLFADPVKGEIFPEKSSQFSLRDAWPAPVDAKSTIVAYFQKSGQPAITWKPFGKGRVIVVWASTILPAMLSDGYPFLRDLARWSGVHAYSEGDSPSLWTNLLKHKTKKAYYGLVYHAFNHSSKPKFEGDAAPTKSTRWFIPEGKYRITELISGADLGTRTAADLGKQGIGVKLEQGAVAIYRIEQVR